MQTIGSVLKKYREKSQLSIDKFSELTKLPQKIILEIESDNFDVISDDFYARKYIKTYARYLHLDVEKLISVYEEQTGRKTDTVESKAKPTQTRVIITPKILKLIGILLVALSVISYLVFQVSAIFEEPYLEVSTPSSDLVITESFIEIRGRTEKEASVFVNDKEIFTDNNGFFGTTLDLSEGINLITITSKKKHSKESIIYREILVQ